MSNRTKGKTLLESFKEQVVKSQNNKALGRMKTEHSIFIPAQLMRDQSQDTKDFILFAKLLRKNTEFNCEVTAEEKPAKSLSGAGIEFIFEFSEDTDFDGIIREIEARLANS
jgi:hypothetical protein